MSGPRPSAPWLTASEVARALRVSTKTVSRWAKEGTIPAWLWEPTLGGHRRYRLEVRAWAAEFAALVKDGTPSEKASQIASERVRAALEEGNGGWT